MNIALITLASALILAGFVPGAHAQDKKIFPTNDEINLLLTQTERAMEQYKPLIDQEEQKMGKGGADAAARDRMVVSALELAIKALKVKPQAFNGPGGFAVFEWLDDASRNATLCASGLGNEATERMLAGNLNDAKELIHLSQSCLDISTLIYTVSENAGALYERYVGAEQDVASQSVAMMQRCVEVLKKNGPPPNH